MNKIRTVLLNILVIIFSITYLTFGIIGFLILLALSFSFIKWDYELFKYFLDIIMSGPVYRSSIVVSVIYTTIICKD